MRFAGNHWIILIAILSIAAWGGKSRKKDPPLAKPDQGQTVSETGGEESAASSSDNQNWTELRQKVQNTPPVFRPQKFETYRLPTSADAVQGAPTAEIVRIEKQIQEIIATNEILKVRYHSQAAEIQRISEQARIHQRILRELQKAVAAEGAGRPVDLAAISQREKIRLIREEIDKKVKFIEVLQQDGGQNPQSQPAAQTLHPLRMDSPKE